jgi:hypothetical protein
MPRKSRFPELFGALRLHGDPVIVPLEEANAARVALSRFARATGKQFKTEHIGNAIVIYRITGKKQQYRSLL